MRLTKQETSPRIIISRILSQPMVPPPPPYETSHPLNGKITYPTLLSGAIYTGTECGCTRTQWQPWQKPKWLISNPPRNFLPNSAWKRAVLNSTNTTTSANHANTKSRKQKCVWTTIGRAKRLVGWESTMRIMPDPRCFYLIYSCIE
jgi:hypothetical protein